MERADVALAEAKANTSAVLRSKETTLAFAERKLERNVDLRRRNLISENDLDQLTTERDNARLDLDAARDQQKITALELAKARTLLDIRTIRSPTDGLVTERNLPPGNLVAEKPVVVIEKTDPLYIEVALPANLFGRVKVGDTYQVGFSVPGVEQRDVKVSLVDTVIESASNTFGVRLVLDNPDNAVPAGAKCHVAFPEN
jgi:RND family efflux transporter MFP subunit